VKAVGLILLLGVIIALIYVTQRPKHRAGHIYMTPTPEILTNVTDLWRPPTQVDPVSAEDPEFVQRVMPGVRTFFATLDRAGVNPLNGELPFNNIRIRHGPRAMDCRFLIGDTWSATFLETKDFAGIIHFGQRGPDNPFGAISHANTNALRRIAQNAIKMPEAEAERILNLIADTFGADRSKYEKPEVHPEKMFEYDLGLWTMQYRKKGSDPINQANYTLSFTIKATSPTTAMLIDFNQAPKK
jgi:hypothetical protein